MIYFGFFVKRPDKRMALVYLGMGTNLGAKEENLNRAKELILLKIGDVLNISSNYSSKAWGFESENDFLNNVLLIHTLLSPENLLEKLKEIEVKMGRKFNTHHTYTDRIIDIDILFYESRIVRGKNLIIPHPYIAERDFVLYPLAEIAPEMIHPVTNKTILQMKNELLNA
ncbi:MAG: 2-amino-4-hydroxy-6-hydroxymethyldihydropteridine diphosphokinase [Paludibacteraceae bacterium]